MDYEKLCKHFIKLMFNTKLEDIEVTMKGATYITLHGSWECKFSFNKGKVRWGQASGRWRDLEEDIKLSYKAEDGYVVVCETIAGCDKRLKYKV